MLVAKKTTTESGEKPTGKEIRLAAESTVKAFNTATNEYLESHDELKETLGDAKEIAIKKHLNLKAFTIVKGLHDSVKNAKNESIAAEKLAGFLAQFDKLREWFELDKLANLQGRMFGTGVIGGEPQADGEPPREADEDGEPDMRPTHLRQPGASAASAVQDLAAKSGAKTQASNVTPIDQVGRGKPTTDPKLN